LRDGFEGEGGRLAEKPRTAPKIMAVTASHSGRGIPETSENNQATASPRIAPLRISNGRARRVEGVVGVRSEGGVIGSSHGFVRRPTTEKPTTKKRCGENPTPAV